MRISPVVSRKTNSKGSHHPLDQSRVDLTTTLYGELRKLATNRMAGEYGPQTLQATALVHEAWLGLGGDNQPEWANRAHFYAAVAEAMRNILVDRARKRQRACHGGDLQRIEVSNWERLEPSNAVRNDVALLVLNEALERLVSIDPETASVVKLHYFAGLTIHEVAEAMNLSERTTRRRLAYARAWLGHKIRQGLAA